jgi:hypothetical protein
VDAASIQHLSHRGAPRLLEHCAALERVTSGEGPSARARLELELGDDLAELLVGALAGSGSRRPLAAACC